MSAYEWDCPNCGEHIHSNTRPPLLAATPALDPKAVLRALWECGVASGMDTDSDAGPEAMIAGMGEAAFASAMVEQVRQLRRDYDEATATDNLSESDAKVEP